MPRRLEKKILGIPAIDELDVPLTLRLQFLDATPWPEHWEARTCPECDMDHVVNTRWEDRRVHKCPDCGTELVEQQWG